ncbi:MAG: sugar phosphate nucleotidyltransferase, partial [Patescibacteria group bacterium]
LVEVPHPSEYGVPVMDGHNIKQFLEKPTEPPSNFISSGLYMLEPEVFKHADFSQPIVMIEHDIFPKLAAEGKLYGFKPPNARWYDCGTLERWERAIKEW